MDVRITSFLVWFSYLSVVSGDVGLSPIYDTGDIRYLEYKVTNVIQCNITGLTPATAKDFHIIWLKEDKVITAPIDTENPKMEFKGEYNEKLYIHRTKDEDIVKYSCVLANQQSRKIKKDIDTFGIPTVKVLSQGTFIEGQKISLECMVAGKPVPKIEWKFNNNQTLTGADPRIQLLPNKANIPNGTLLIDEARMSDRGLYSCIASNKASEFFNSTIEHTAFVRVKDKLAALWPFMGICAEVVVLCAIIFIYERKRNKAELDESDTDQSPEQKNTPDHGKESVRQRK